MVTSIPNKATMQGSATGLTGSEKVVSGSVKIADGAEIDTKGKTLQQIVDEINAQGLDGVTASITDGRFTITSESGVVEIKATGDFARVTGVANYTVEAVAPMTPSDSADELYKGNFTNSIDRLTEEEAIAQGYTIIKTAQDLDNIRNNLSGKYILMADIDLSSYSNWTAIGDSTNGFTGELNGNGYVIKNLTINRADEDYVGLFAAIGDNSGTTGEVKNLGLENANINGYRNVAGLTGMNYGTITNCYVTGIVTGDICTGGLIGYNYGITRNSFATGSVDGAQYTGGLIGHDSGGTISNSYALSNIISGGGYTGGLVGYKAQGTISDSYTLSDVTGQFYVGGLVGYIDSRATISNTYVSGIVQGNSNVGGLIGQNNNATVENSIWNTETTGQSVAIGANNGTETNNKGLTTTEMQNPDNWVGWDTDIWDFTTYPPTLKQTQPSTNSQTLTGTVDTRDFSGDAFYGQTSGSLTFSDGTTVSISASDNLDAVLAKLNAVKRRRKKSFRNL